MLTILFLLNDRNATGYCRIVPVSFTGAVMLWKKTDLAVSIILQKKKKNQSPIASLSLNLELPHIYPFLTIPTDTTQANILKFFISLLTGPLEYAQWPFDPFCTLQLAIRANFSNANLIVSPPTNSTLPIALKINLVYKPLYSLVNHSNLNLRNSWTSCSRHTRLYSIT